MPFDADERERIRYHMGYLNVAPASSLAFGIPVPVQTLYLVEMSMDNILPSAEDRVRRFLTILDKIECKMIEGLDYLVTNKVDDITIDPELIEKLEAEYCRWAARLSDTVGAPLFPGAAKFRKLFMVQGVGSVPVRNGR